jgi:hypothetical protein
MKLTAKLLKQMVREARDKQKKDIFKSDLSSYELEDIDTDHQTVDLLSGILNQLKTLVYFSTPARGPAAAGAEKALAGTIQEGLKYEDDILDGLSTLGVEELPPEIQDDIAAAAVQAAAAIAMDAQGESGTLQEESLALIRKLIEEEISNVLNEKGA